jgi:magnesium-transporting ATPase (P-type)
MVRRIDADTAMNASSPLAGTHARMASTVGPVDSGATSGGSSQADAHARSVSAVCASLGSDAASGLTEAVARERLTAVGPNTIVAAPPIPRWRKLLAQFESPLVLLLIAAAAVSFAVSVIEGHGTSYEALTILAIVVLNAALGFFQEARAERAVAGLRSMTAATAEVVRDGARRRWGTGSTCCTPGPRRCSAAGAPLRRPPECEPSSVASRCCCNRRRRRPRRCSASSTGWVECLA